MSFITFSQFAGYCEGYLLVYSDTHIDVFDCQAGDWLQTLNVKKAKPLNTSGSLTTCIINDMPHVIYLSNLHQRKFLIFLRKPQLFVNAVALKFHLFQR